MKNEWIVDVLADLKAFAAANGLQATAAGLEDATLVAMAELSSRRPQNVPGPIVDAPNVTQLFAGRGYA